jgi:hypothetical protein
VSSAVSEEDAVRVPLAAPSRPVLATPLKPAVVAGSMLGPDDDDDEDEAEGDRSGSDADHRTRTKPPAPDEYEDDFF